jgi:hypothetical protein
MIDGLEPIKVPKAARETSNLPSTILIESERLLECNQALGRVLNAGEFALADRLEKDLRDARSVPCSAEIAEMAVKRLLGCYPDRKVVDAKTFTYTLIRVFMEYPAAFVLRVCSPVHGLPSTLKFFPSVADVSTALREMSEKAAAKCAGAWQGYRQSRKEPEPDLRQLRTVEERKERVIRELGYDPLTARKTAPWCFDPEKPPENAPWRDPKELEASAKRIRAEMGLVEFDVTDRMKGDQA